MTISHWLPALYALAGLTVLPLAARMHPALMTAGYMLAVTLNEETYYVLAYNLEWIRPTPGLLSYWLYKIHLYVLYPVALLWTTDLLFRLRRPSARWAAAAVYIAFMGAADHAFVLLGHYTLVRWTPLFSIVRYGTLLLLTTLAIRGLRRLMAHNRRRSPV